MWLENDLLDHRKDQNRGWEALGAVATLYPVCLGDGKSFDSD